MPDEKMYITALVLGLIDNYRHSLTEVIDRFYKNYDPLKSIDKSFICRLISNVVDDLDNSVEFIERSYGSYANSKSNRK